MLDNIWIFDILSKHLHDSHLELQITICRGDLNQRPASCSERWFVSPRLYNHSAHSTAYCTTQVVRHAASRGKKGSNTFRATKKGKCRPNFRESFFPFLKQTASIPTRRDDFTIIPVLIGIQISNGNETGALRNRASQVFRPNLRSFNSEKVSPDNLPTIWLVRITCQQFET